MTETRSISSTGGEKGTKDERFDLLPPEALAKIARHFGVGAKKYDDHNWRRGYEWSKSYAALQRHANAFWAGEDIDDETGSPHMAAVAFHAMALLVFMDDHPDFDDRFTADTSLVTVDPDGIGTVYDSIPTVAGFYRDRTGDIWEGRAVEDDNEALSWTIARWKVEGRARPLRGREVWSTRDLRTYLPFTRVSKPDA